MNRETTPAKITDKIIELCNEIVPGEIPQYIPVKPQEWSRPMECFPNVEKMVQEYGGQQVNGRAIWQWSNILVEAEAHAVWKSPEGQLIDITPHDYNEEKILFLCDKSMTYDGEQIGNIRLALTGSPLVDELIELSRENEQIMREYEPGTKIPPTEFQMKLAALGYRKRTLIMQLNRKVDRNDPCPCMSGLKYKKCCGR